MTPHQHVEALLARVAERTSRVQRQLAADTVVVELALARNGGDQLLTYWDCRFDFAMASLRMQLAGGL